MTRSGTAQRLVLSGSAGFAVTYEALVLTRPGRRLDDAVMAHTVAWLGRSPGWSSLAEQVLDAVSVASCVAVVLLLALMAYAAGRTRQAVVALVTAAAVASLAQVLKVVLLRPGSELTGVANSLPSGHVAAVAGLVAAAVIASAPRRRWWVVAAGSPAVVTVGVAVVASGWHRPSDVLASIFLAVSVCGCALCVVGEVDPPSVVGPGPLRERRRQRVAAGPR